MADGARLVPQAFDAFAAGYDAEFTHRPAAQWLREQVRRRATPFLRPGMAALDLGCGTGEDAVWLVSRGCRVTATDGSPLMLARVQDKAAQALAADRVKAQLLDLNAPGDLGGPFDFVLSNFGALNCAADLAPVVASLAASVPPGGTVALVVMGRFCAWETLYYGLRLRRAAFRRWWGRSSARIGDADIAIRYWSVPEVTRALGAAFELRALHGIGIFLPPSYLFGLASRWPGLFVRFARWDAALSENPWLARVADHQLFLFERKSP